MKINSKAFRVGPGEQVQLKKCPTLVKPRRIEPRCARITASRCVLTAQTVIPTLTVMRSNLASLLFVATVSFGAIGCASIGPPRNVEPVVRKMEVTAYCACGDCCGWRRTWFGRPVVASGPNRGKPKQVGTTASGGKAHRGTIAADTTRYPFGTIMQIDGFGYGRVEDRGGAIKGDHIDLFFPSHRDAILWGRRHLNVRVWFMPSLRGELLDLETLLAMEEPPAEVLETGATFRP